MVDSLYPEAVRGLWFMAQDGEGMRHQLEQLTGELYSFDIQGRFMRVVLREGLRREHESGDYTFDGNFLITRGRSTETFRVTVESPTLWLLEGKRGMVWLSRRALGDDDEEREPDALDGELARELRILPIRVRFEPWSTQVNLEAWRVLYDRDGRLDPPICLGSISVDRDSAQSLWFGVTPYLSGLDERTWTRFVSEAFMSKNPPERQTPLKSLQVQLLDSGHRHEVKL